MGIAISWLPGHKRETVRDSWDGGLLHGFLLRGAAGSPAGDASMNDARTARVDIVLPTHRRPHTIAYSIESVLRQTHRSLTLHVVGDGCDAATEAVVRAFDDPRVIFHGFPKGHGYGYANRNSVLTQCTGDCIAYATDDDLWFPDHLEHGLSVLEELSLDLVATRSVHVRSSGEVDPYFFAFDWQTPVLGGFLRNWFLGALTIVHRRSLFDRIGYWDEALARFGDRELLARARADSVAIAYRNRPTVLRFYAQDWDEHYAGLAEPPQRRFLDRLGDPHWCEQVRAAAAPGPRSLDARRRQWLDFARFARRSGPKFVRFWIQRRRTHDHRDSTLAQRAT